jgi:hypothetical protein
LMGVWSGMWMWMWMVLTTLRETAPIICRRGL